MQRECREVCMIHSTEELVFKVCLMTLVTKARLVGGHGCMTLMSMMDFTADANTILCHIMPQHLIDVFVLLHDRLRMFH